MRLLVGRVGKSIAFEKVAKEENPPFIIMWNYPSIAPLHQFPVLSLNNDIPLSEWIPDVVEALKERSSNKVFIYTNLATDDKLHLALQLTQFEKYEKEFDLDILITLQTSHTDTQIIKYEELDLVSL